MAKKAKNDKGKKSKPGRSDVAKSAPVAPSEPEVDEKPDPCSHISESYSEDLGCLPNAYPGLLEFPEPLTIVGSESGTHESLCHLLNAGFRYAERVLMMTSWGSFVIFRVKGSCRTVYFIFDGCTCNVKRFRYLDLNVGTAGLLFYKSTHEILQYIMNSKLKRDQKL